MKMLLDGKQMNGERIGLWLAVAFYNGKWAVRHVPSGMILWTGKNRQDARRKALLAVKHELYLGFLLPLVLGVSE